MTSKNPPRHPKKRKKVARPHEWVNDTSGDPRGSPRCQQGLINSWLFSLLQQISSWLWEASLTSLFPVYPKIYWWFINRTVPSESYNSHRESHMIKDWTLNHSFYFDRGETDCMIFFSFSFSVNDCMIWFILNYFNNCKFWQSQIWDL